MKKSAFALVVAAASLILFQFFFILARPFPILMDDGYHLSVIRAFYENRNIQFWNYWEFAPYGRPHLYPPLFHAAGAALGLLINAVFGLGAQNSVLKAFLFLKAVSYPFLLFSVWWLSRKLFRSEEGALYSLILVMGVFAVFLAAEAMVPSAFALALLNFLVISFFLERRSLASVILLAAIAYTHLGVFLVAQLFILIYSSYRRKFTQFTVIVEAAAMVLYAPWLAHLLLNAGWFQGVERAFGLTLPLFVWLPAVACALAWRRQIRERAPILFAYMAALLPMLFSYGHRFWIYVALPLSVLGGCAIAQIRSRPQKALVVCAALVAFLFYAPTIYDNESFTGHFAPTTIMGGLFVESPLSIELTKLRILDSPLSREERELAAWVNSNTAKTGIIMAGESGFSDMIYATTARRASGGTWHETAPAWLLEKSREYDLNANGTLICGPPCRDVNSEFVAKIGRLEVRKRG